MKASEICTKRPKAFKYVCMHELFEKKYLKKMQALLIHLCTSSILPALKQMQEILHIQCQSANVYVFANYKD